MKKSLVLAMAMALGVTASAYAANPFSDVPAGHWAYDSVAKLADAGVVDGYGAEFGGDKLMTRYEMAQITAKAMAKGCNVDKLAAEFADELDTLGVRVANLEKKADNVKVTGAIRYRYVDAEGGNKNDLRTRLWVKGQVNEDWSYTGMVQSVENFDNDAAEEDIDFQRAYVEGKLGGLDVTAGRYNAYFGDGYVYDTRADGVEASYNVGAVKLTAFAGKGTDIGYGDDGFVANYVDGMADKADSYGDYLAVEAATEVAGLDLTVGYADFNEMRPGLYDAAVEQDSVVAGEGLDNKIWWAQLGETIGHVGLKATYLKGDFEGLDGLAADGNKYLDDDGYAFAVSYKGAKASEPGSWGLALNYWNQGAATYVAHTTDANTFAGMGFKGYGVVADYALAKNIVATLAWYDTEAKYKEGALAATGEAEDEILWADVTFTF